MQSDSRENHHLCSKKKMALCTVCIFEGTHNKVAFYDQTIQTLCDSMIARPSESPSLGFISHPSALENENHAGLYGLICLL